MSEHITINADRSVTVPQSLRKAGVQFDHNVNTITFDCPRYCSNVDLSTLIFYVNYLLPDNTKGSCKATNVVVDETDENLLHFDWTISRNVTGTSGMLTCLVCAKKTNAEGNEENHWNSSLFKTLSIDEGMENSEIIEEEYPDLITQMLLGLESTDQTVTELGRKVGNSEDLDTENKTNLVAAVNEVKSYVTDLDTRSDATQNGLEQLQKHVTAIAGAYDITWTDGGYISSTDGTVQAEEGSSYSNFIPVEPGTRLIIANTMTADTEYNAFYNASETFVSSFSNATGALIVPEGVTQMRLSKYTSATVMVASDLQSEIDSAEEKIDNAKAEIGELKSDLVELDNLIFLNRKKGIGTFALYWKYTEVINDINLYKDKTYKIRCICNPAPTQSAYLVLSNSDNLHKTYQLQNESDITFYLTMTEDAENIKASICSDTHVGTCEVIIEESYNEIEKIEKRVIDIEDGYRHFEKAFVVGERYNSIDTSVKTKVSMATNTQLDYDILVKVNDGYEALIVYYNETGSYMKNSGWFHYPDTKMVEANSIFGIQIVKYPTSEIVTDIDLYKNQVSYSTKIETKILDLEYNANSRIHNSNLYHILCRDKYLHHIDVDYYNGLIIPSQSIFDIRRAKRLGFNIIELNVQTTSDGVFYVGHGRAGCFGDAYYSVDGTDLTDVLISSVTSEYIQQNVRYKSKYDKYKVALTTLRDALIECKLNNLIPLIGYKDGVIEFTEKIMGKDNFLVGLYGNDRGTKTDAICFSWLTGDYNSVIQKANKSKGAYVCGINPTDSMYVDYTQEDWNTFVEKIHEAGYFVNTCYETKQQLQMFLKAGFDIISSRYCINDIEHGNLCNLESDLTFEDFNTDGTVSNGVLTLNTNQTLSPKETIENVFLGGGSLRIIFSGKILVELGQINEEYESDGKKELWFSSFIQENSPTFTITAIENTDILEILYKASKM